MRILRKDKVERVQFVYSEKEKGRVKNFLLKNGYMPAEQTKVQAIVLAMLGYKGYSKKMSFKQGLTLVPGYHRMRAERPLRRAK